jgi:hypothetical protein
VTSLDGPHDLVFQGGVRSDREDKCFLFMVACPRLKPTVFLNGCESTKNKG